MPWYLLPSKQNTPSWRVHCIPSRGMFYLKSIKKVPYAYHSICWHYESLQEINYNKNKYVFIIIDSGKLSTVPTNFSQTITAVLTACCYCHKFNSYYPVSVLVFFRSHLFFAFSQSNPIPNLFSVRTPDNT